ncbi:MAG: cell division protein SepF [Candidatus Nanohaloarchaea archaeon]
MPLDFLKKDGEAREQEVVEDEFVELDARTAEKDEKVVVKAHTLKEYEDVEAVQEKLRDDSIVWINIRPLKNKDMADLKRAVNRLKKTVKAVDGDMAGVDEEWIVVCPEYATIERSGKMADS